MLAYKELEELLKVSVQWEKQLLDLYEVAKLGVRAKDSKKLIMYLQDKQSANLDVLKNIKIKDYGRTEWVQFASDFHVKELIPKKQLKRDSSPQEIISHVLQYEEGLKEYYQAVAELLRSEKQKELFESLVVFKAGQIETINNFMNKQLMS